MAPVRWLDVAYLRLARPRSCFQDGWGESALLDSPFGDRDGPPAAPAPIRWTRTRTKGPIHVLEGSFESEETALPRECRTARVRLISPRGKRGAVCIVFAAWGDETFAMRERMFSGVLEHGISLLLFENPFYGSRRRIGQTLSRLCTVSDFVLMGRAAIRDSHALFAWAKADGFDRIGVAGYSMGGQMSAMSAALASFPMVTVAMAPAASAASVFLDGPLRRDLDWRSLGADGETKLRALFGSLSVLELPRPIEPGWAVLVGTKRDLIVKPDDVRAIGKYWGVHPRWLDDGHVSAAAFRGHALSQAIVDGFARSR
jgi:hypothetical protein